MKKKLLIFLTVLLLLLFTGCGNTESSDNVTEEDPDTTIEMTVPIPIQRGWQAQWRLHVGK